ncbi:MAG: hypothetical protein JXR40_11225 [Pontiellaceae bacterium]|nr:hypothetical protein [Pontiellaceae bacterium]
MSLHAEQSIPASIPDVDVRSIIQILGEIAMLSGSLELKRRILISGLAEIIDADGWLWVAGGVDQKRKIPMTMGILSGGLNDQQLAGLLNSPSDMASASPLNEPFAVLVAEGKHFVRTRQQLVEGYIRDLYRHFNVTSQFSLIHHFQKNERS